MKKSLIGQRGEELAARHLIDQGWIILSRNWRSGRQELDIIAQDGSQVVFIEVKTRSSRRFGQPIEFIDATKQDHMVKAATQWLMDQGWEGEFRFDLIGIHIISSSFREYIIKPFCQIRSHSRKKAGGAFISIPIRPSAPLEHLQLPSAVLQIQRQTVHYTKVREGNCVFVHRRYSNRQQFENSCF